MKNVPNRTKIVQGKKKCAFVAHYGHYGIELPCLPCMALKRLARDREDSRKFEQGKFSDFFKLVSGGVTHAIQLKFGKIKLSIFIVN